MQNIQKCMIKIIKVYSVTQHLFTKLENGDNLYSSKISVVQHPQKTYLK